MWWFGARRRLLGAVALVMVLSGVAVVAPPSYFTRLSDTVDYQEDNSAQSRLQAWGAALRMARDYPLGVGARNFNSAYGRWYNPSTGGEGTARIEWNSLRWMSPHSIYFGVIGEYGFGGFVLLLVLIGSLLTANHRSRDALRRAPEGAPIDDRWPALINMSLVGFAVSGAFLGGFHYPHLFFITALTLSLKRIIQAEGGGLTTPAVSRALRPNAGALATRTGVPATSWARRQASSTGEGR